MFFIALSLGVTSIAVSGDFDKGFVAVRSGDYATALQEFRPFAEQGDASAQYNLGSLYAAFEQRPAAWQAYRLWCQGEGARRR